MTVRQSYGTADIGCLGYECMEKNGMHIPDDKIVEIVDPETGKQLKPGEVGEIVATTFNKVYPLIRFGTGDLSSLSAAPCPCGRTSPRLVKDSRKGRPGDEGEGPLCPSRAGRRGRFQASADLQDIRSWSQEKNTRMR